MSRLVAVVLVLLLASACQKGATSGEAGDGKVAFRTSDGFLLEGELSGDGPDAVILAHMFPSDMSSWKDYATRLDASYRVLRFNFRGYGESEGARDIALLDRDITAAISFMRKQGADRVVVIGASMGGTAALIAGASTKLDGVIAISSPESFQGLDAATVVQKVQSKMLFIACVDDPAGAAKSAQRMFKAALDPSSDLRLLACSDHGTDIFRGDRGEEVEEVIGGFLSKVMA